MKDRRSFRNQLHTTSSRNVYKEISKGCPHWSRVLDYFAFRINQAVEEDDQEREIYLLQLFEDLDL